MWRTLIGMSGCASIAPWDYQAGLAQSTTGSNPIVTVHAVSSPRYLTIECAADGLQLSLGERGEVTTLRIDDLPPEAWPTRISARGVPVLDLRTPIAGGATGEQRLSEASRLALLGPADSTVATFDVSNTDRAIRRLRCP